MHARERAQPEKSHRNCNILTLFGNSSLFPGLGHRARQSWWERQVGSHDAGIQLYPINYRESCKSVKQGRQNKFSMQYNSCSTMWRTDLRTPHCRERESTGRAWGSRRGMARAWIAEAAVGLERGWIQEISRSWNRWNEFSDLICMWREVWGFQLRWLGRWWHLSPS